MVQLTNEVIAYIAGFFDGEGSVSIVRYSRRKGEVCNMVVQITQSSPDVLEFIKKYFGGSITPSYTKLGTKIWRYLIASKKAEKFLLAVKPYIIVKRQQVNLALCFRYTCKLDHKGVQVPKYLGDLRDDFKNALQSLNSKRIRRGEAHEYRTG